MFPLIFSSDSVTRNIPSRIIENIVVPTSIEGIGRHQIKVSNSVSNLCLDVNSARVVGGTVYVNDTTGNDSNAGTEGEPFKTLSQALRTSNAGLIYVAAGTYAPSDVRLTDTPQGQVSGGIVKRMVAQGQVTIKVKYDTISTLTWTITEGYSTVYEAQLTSIGASPARVQKVIDSNVLDSYNQPSSLYKYSSIALLDAQASGHGWYYDAATKKLYVSLGGTNVETYKENLEALYTDANGLSRMLIYGTKLIMDGFDLKGVNPYLLLYTTTRPELYIQNCSIKWAEDHGILVQGGLAYSQNCHIHASKNDNFNYSPSGGYLGFGQEIDCWSSAAGDELTFGNSLGDNRNASSCHGGASIVRFGGLYEGSSGPDIADTCVSGQNSDGSWMIGVHARNSSAENAVSRIGIGIYGGSQSGGDRIAWLDRCKGTGDQYGVYQTDGSTVNDYNGTYGSIGGSLTTYNPKTPG